MKPPQRSPSTLLPGGEPSSRAREERTALTVQADRLRVGLMSRMAFVLAIGFVVAGCGRLGWGDDPPAPEPEPPAAEIEPPPLDAPAEEGPETLILDEAEHRFDEGDLEGAARLFQEYLGGQTNSDSEREAQALWGLAMIHILPESPIQNRDRALGLLDRLVTEHATSVRGAQARWLLSTLEELEAARTQVSQQQALVQQLTETVEQLRRIDLNRRPTGGGTRPDTLPLPPSP